MELARSLTAVFITACLLSGCRKEEAPKKPTPPKKEVSTTARGSAGDEDDLKAFLNRDAPPPTDQAALPPGHPPIDGDRASRPEPGPTGLPAGHPPIGGEPASKRPGLPPLEYDAPESWLESQPTRPFRAAEFTIPRAEGDAVDGQLIVYYFGPDQGGGIEDNLARWRGMFSTADGKPVGEDAATIEKIEANGLAVTTIDVQGRYVDAMSPPNQAGPTGGDYRMLGAIVESPDGKWFFKGVGPAATMSAQRDGFMKMLKSLRRP